MTEAPTATLTLLKGVANAIVQDLLHWPIQLALALSAIGCLAGILAFRRNGAAIGTKPQASSVRTMLYWVSLLPSFAWYVLPFLPQARFPSLLDGLQSGNSLTLIVGLVGAAVAIWNAVAAMRVVAENGKATGPAMVDFLQPAYLLEKGPYARVRHPMFLHDFLTHAGLVVATGALTTFALLPLYFLCSAAFNLAEETWVLKPRFAGAFVAYKQRVPGCMTASRRQPSC